MVYFFLTRAIEQIKKFDPEAFLPLNAHIGKSILLDVDLPLSGATPIYLFIEQDNIAVMRHVSAQSADFTLSGKLFDLGRFGLDYLQLDAQTSQAATIGLLHRHHIQCYGEMALLYAFQAMLKNIDLDWTHLWSSIVGDKLAFPIASFFKKSTHQIKKFTQNSLYSAKEYITYETNCLAPSIEIENWIEDIMILRNDSERLEKNLALLKKRIEHLT